MTGVGTKSISWQWCGAVAGMALLSSAMLAVAQAPAGGAGATGSSSLAPLDRLIRQIECEFLHKCELPLCPTPPCEPPPQCDTLPEDGVAYFQQLEREYFKIRQALEDSSKQRVKLLNTLRSAGFTCNASLKNDYQAQMASVKALKVADTLEALRKISRCVKPEMEKRQEPLRRPMQPHTVEKIMGEIDKLRTREFDALNMTMDLAYFGNKIGRLVEEYETNLRDYCR